MESTAGVAQVDVLERRARGGHRGRLDAVRLERAEYGRYRGGPVAGPGAERATVEGDLDDADDAVEGAMRVRATLLSQLNLDRVAREVALEPVGGTFHDDATAIDDRDPGGEPVGLLHVVRGQEDGHELLIREP